MPRPFPYESENYPFTSTSSFVVGEGARFPRGFLLDAHVYAWEPGIYGITHVKKQGGRFQLTVAMTGNKGAATAGGECGSGQTQLDLFDRYQRRAGVLLIDNLDLFLGFPDGDYVVSGGALRFEASCHVPVSAGCVEGFVIEREMDYGDTSTSLDESLTQTFITGNIRLTGGQGVALVRDGNTLVIHFVGEPYGHLWQDIATGLSLHDKWVASVWFDVRSTLGSEYSTTKQLFPDENGNILLYLYNMMPLERDALRVSGEENKLTFRLAGK